MIPSRGGPAPSIHVFAPRAQLRIPQLASLTQTPHAQRTHHDRYTGLRTDLAPPTHGEQTYPETMSDIIIPGIGSLEPAPALTALAERGVATASSALVVAIDPELADTEVMTREFGMDLALSSNCILVAGKRAGEERIAACVVRATTNADVNHVVKKRLDVRKASFWPQERAVEASGMEYGGITPVGVPGSWRLLIDSACSVGWSCIGSGLRRSKLFVTGEVLAALPGAEIVEGLGV